MAIDDRRKKELDDAYLDALGRGVSDPRDVDPHVEDIQRVVEDALLEHTMGIFSSIVRVIQERFFPLSRMEKEYILGKTFEDVAGPIDWNEVLGEPDWDAIKVKLMMGVRMPGGASLRGRGARMTGIRLVLVEMEPSGPAEEMAKVRLRRSIDMDALRALGVLEMDDSELDAKAELYPLLRLEDGADVQGIINHFLKAGFDVVRWDRDWR